MVKWPVTRECSPVQKISRHQPVKPHRKKFASQSSFSSAKKLLFSKAENGKFNFIYI